MGAGRPADGAGLVFIGAGDRDYDVMDGGAEFDVCLFGAGDIPLECEY